MIFYFFSTINIMQQLNNEYNFNFEVLDSFKP